MIYSAPSYQMGDELVYETGAAATAPVTKQHARSARAELERMRRSLAAWLRYRAINTRVAAGQPYRPATLRRPGTPARHSPYPGLAARRARDEQRLATQLHALLSEVFDQAQLPLPDVSSNPNAAVELARIAIAGKLPGEVSTPQEQGFVWLWPVVIVVGAIAFVITSAIRSSADAAKERERLECIKAGACTDSGFWLKAGALAFIGWLAWDKLGLGAKLKGAMK